MSDTPAVAMDAVQLTMGIAQTILNVGASSWELLKQEAAWHAIAKLIQLGVLLVGAGVSYFPAKANGWKDEWRMIAVIIVAVVLYCLPDALLALNHPDVWALRELLK